MKWSAKTGERVFLWPVMVVLAPVWVSMVAVIYVSFRIDWVWRAIAQRFAHPAEAHRWFAWRPVQMSAWSDHSYEWRWMETIWRGRDRWGETALAPTRESLESAQ